MIWEYRVMRRNFSESQFDIVEAYYDTEDCIDTDLPEPHSWTERAVGASGDSVESVREDLELMLREAFAKPVLDEAELLRKRGIVYDQLVTRDG